MKFLLLFFLFSLNLLASGEADHEYESLKADYETIYQGRAFEAYLAHKEAPQRAQIEIIKFIRERTNVDKSPQPERGYLLGALTQSFLRITRHWSKI